MASLAESECLPNIEDPGFNPSALHNQMWRHTSVIAALRRWRPEDPKFKVFSLVAVILSQLS